MKTHSFILLLALSLTACGSRQIARNSPLDTPQNHYQQGLVDLQEGRVVAAERGFDRARQLDADYPGSYVGLALVALARSDFHRARQQVEQAMRRDRKFVDAHIAKGRIISAEGVEWKRDTSTWLAEAERAYAEAERINPEVSDIYWHWAQSYLLVGNLPQAKSKLERILEGGRGEWVEQALEEVERIQKVERSAPGSSQGQAIGLKSAITRAELAILLVEELKLPELVRKRGAVSQRVNAEGVEPSDIGASWARPWIETVLALGISGLEVFPDGSFRPDEPVSRAEYALVNQGILVLLSGDRGLATRYIGEPSRFPDVRSDYYAYNAIAVCVERGLLQVADRRTGLFQPDASVAGADALLVVRELQNAFRMEY